MKKVNIFHLTLIAVLVSIGTSSVSTCKSASYIIPYSPLDTFFDTGVDSIHAQSQMSALIGNPSSTTAQAYFSAIAPLASPLFVMAGLAIVIFIASIVQVICFNVCEKQCCGKQITSYSYNVCCVKLMVWSFLFLGVAVVGLNIAAIIINSDLQKAVEYTMCNAENIIYQSYNGNDNTTIPWSGINYFQTDIDTLSINLQNNVPALTTYFSSSNSAYSQITDTAASSLYNDSQIFSCANSNGTVKCPFPNSTCASSYQASFNVDFCDVTVTTSAYYLISQQMSTNSTVWYDNTVLLSSSLSTLNSSTTDISSLTEQITNFVSSVGSYQQSIDSGMDFGQTVINAVEIALYVFYSFILFSAILGVVGVCMFYCCNSFKCMYIAHLQWYLMFFLSFLLFITAGIFLGVSLFSYDACLAYPYYFNNSTNFKQITFGNQQLGSIFTQCYFNTSAGSIFSAFNNTDTLATIGSIQSQYTLAVPSSNFYSVVTTIQNTLLSYSFNPSLISIVNATSTQQPYYALSLLNTVSNASLSNTTQNCSTLKTYDLYTWNPTQCSPFLTSALQGASRCIPLQNGNASTVTTTTSTNFNTSGCTFVGEEYVERVAALQEYSDSIITIVQELAPITSTSSNPLQQYELAYFNYYTAVLNFYNTPITQQFQSIFTPYQLLADGSSCSFVKTSMTGIMNTSCNQLQPYINTLMALTIADATFVFIMFVLGFYLTARFRFYVFLEGNFDNFGIDSNVDKEFVNYENGAETNSRNIQLISNRN